MAWLAPLPESVGKELPWRSHWRRSDDTYLGRNFHDGPTDGDPMILRINKFTHRIRKMMTYWRVPCNVPEAVPLWCGQRLSGSSLNSLIDQQVATAPGRRWRRSHLPPQGGRPNALELPRRYFLSVTVAKFWNRMVPDTLQWLECAQAVLKFSFSQICDIHCRPDSNLNLEPYYSQSHRSYFLIKIGAVSLVTLIIEVSCKQASVIPGQLPGYLQTKSSW